MNKQLESLVEKIMLEFDPEQVEIACFELEKTNKDFLSFGDFLTKYDLYEVQHKSITHGDINQLID